MDIETYGQPTTILRVGAPTIRLEIDPDPSRLFIDISEWQPVIEFPDIGNIVASDGAGTFTVRMWKTDVGTWEVGNNVNIHGGSVLPDGGSGNSGGEHPEGERGGSRAVEHGVYSTVSAPEHGWVRNAYDAVQQRFRRSGSGDGGGVRRDSNDARLGVFSWGGEGTGARPSE